MKPIAISFMRAVPGQDELDIFETIFVDPTVPEDWQVSPEELRKKTEESWRSVTLPNGEQICLTIAISTANDGFSMAIRQENQEIAQLLCEGRPFMSFLTLSGAVIGLQVFDRDQYESTQE